LTVNYCCASDGIRIPPIFVSHIETPPDGADSLANIRRLLWKSGVFIFDSWNGNFVLRDYSPERYKRVENGEDVVMRVKPVLDVPEEIER
jgi:hypothetical protein